MKAWWIGDDTTFCFVIGKMKNETKLLMKNGCKKVFGHPPQPLSCPPASLSRSWRLEIGDWVLEPAGQETASVMAWLCSGFALFAKRVKARIFDE